MDFKRFAALVGATIFALTLSAPIAGANETPIQEPSPIETQSIEQLQKNPDVTLVEIPDVEESETGGFSTQANPNKSSGPGNTPVGTCYIAVWHPSQNPSTPWVGIQGQRAGCKHVNNFTLTLRKERAIGSKTLASKGALGNTTIRTSAQCDGRGKYFGTVSTPNKTYVESDRITLC
ncbi:MULTISPECIES: hypothetical protein [Corynebacterium]|uniref:hypothetical protein n=1 Tax=Corynebacterium TaxID=1716 RepID=UPI0026472502|nr:hypothetical protein [Corynebacterium sp.]MDN6137730.1 hypothetical protein [Corynebacterium sp.]